MSILLSRSVNPENSYRWLKPPGAEFSETEGAVLSSGPEPPAKTRGQLKARLGFGVTHILRLNEAPLHGSSHGSANLRIGRGEGGHARRRRPPGSGHLHFLTLSKSRGRRYGLLRHRLRQKPEPPDSREMSVAGFPSVGRTSGAGFRASEVGGEEMTGGKSFPASACILSLWL
jgi:hypothetical protein